MSLFFRLIQHTFKNHLIFSDCWIGNLNGHYNLGQLSEFVIMCQRDQLPDGLIAQLVEHCTGITEVMDSNPVQA